MLRKTIFTLAALTTLGAAALASTSASAGYYGYGYHGCCYGYSYYKPYRYHYYSNDGY